MSILQLCFITNHPNLIQEIDAISSQRIMIDLEVMHKHKRQKGYGLFISDHSLEDVYKARKQIANSELMVRVNPIHENSQQEIEAVITAGADILMLPMWKSKNEVEQFINLINGKARVNLLLETADAIQNLSEIVKTNNIDEIHIGLNDLKISLGYQTIFDVILNGELDHMARMINGTNIRFGFAGVAPLNIDMVISPKLLIAEQVRLNSTMAIFSRQVTRQLEEKYKPGILSLMYRSIEAEVNKWANVNDQAFINNSKLLAKQITAWKETCRVN